MKILIFDKVEFNIQSAKNYEATLYHNNGYFMKKVQLINLYSINKRISFASYVYYKCKRKILKTE